MRFIWSGMRSAMSELQSNKNGMRFMELMGGYIGGDA